MGATTDYLVVGAGAAGMAFTDALVHHSDAEVVLVDSRPAPGGHWNDAYPFVRLHAPSALYGVASLPLGDDRVGPDGWYERATGPEVLAYYAEVLRRLEATGRVRFLGGNDLVEGTTIRSRATGEAEEVVPRRAVVDATYLRSEVPASHQRSFAVAEGARCVPAGGVVDVEEPVERWVLLGAGKTAADTCLWLLDAGVDPGRITWVRPREPWFMSRAQAQPLEQVGNLFAGVATEIEAGASATSAEDHFLRLEAAGRMLRIDPSVPATLVRGAIIGPDELVQLRQVTDVVRLGYVRRLESERVVLDGGERTVPPGTVFVDCTAGGLTRSPARPVWEPGRITPQQGRMTAPCFNAALIGFLETTDRDLAEKNRLLHPHPYPHTIEDWCRNVVATHAQQPVWDAEPDVSAWIADCRLNALKGITGKFGDPAVLDALVRYTTSVGPAIANLKAVVGD